MKLKATAFGLACGSVLGLASFVATLLSLWRGGGFTITAVAGAYFGYSWSLAGAFIGLFWGVVYGFIFGWLLATIYNRLSG
ncbi:MAG: hypothetical protein GWN99_12130 [Gemmatimonadetes bacterium]|uniref:Uncharacterized protein n=1 Tax=Candidatus Kutchimonas denitrificans TaxID=3056748 RepID=A0AAE5CCC2_9BACT|nr:hypothetical protein [Gemmatimonadota bacterium]NIR75480.1 hypothetical protein [Candidatus Kutchimonas denitrificans]NIS01794.1 hypothetical protein [Gemmatimonadota bacterium]NIT67575.1 hypothetical protein [Gemmatimonadota bacterium]NIU53449.1 hypothetical protein [Gemmatimonadota bacterium]